jgi:hypothetical protein
VTSCETPAGGGHSLATLEIRFAAISHAEHRLVVKSPCDKEIPAGGDLRHKENSAGGDIAYKDSQGFCDKKRRWTFRGHLLKFVRCDTSVTRKFPG